MCDIGMERREVQFEPLAEELPAELLQEPEPVVEPPEERLPTPR